MTAEFYCESHLWLNVEPQWPCSRNTSLQDVEAIWQMPFAELNAFKCQMGDESCIYFLLQRFLLVRIMGIAKQALSSCLHNAKLCKQAIEPLFTLQI